MIFKFVTKGFLQQYVRFSSNVKVGELIIAAGAAGLEKFATRSLFDDSIRKNVNFQTAEQHEDGPAKFSATWKVY